MVFRMLFGWSLAFGLLRGAQQALFPPRPAFQLEIGEQLFTVRGVTQDEFIEIWRAHLRSGEFIDMTSQRGPVAINPKQISWASDLAGVGSSRPVEARR